MAKVRLDGVDVSARSFAADDIEGFVDVYKINQDGKKYLVEGPDGQRVVAQERLRGVVEIELPEKVRA